MKIDIDIEEMRKIAKALELARDFFEARDKMNACVHESTVRYSPITTTMDDAYDLADGILAAMEQR